MTVNLLLPREAAKFIYQNSKDVKINLTGINKTAKLIYESIAAHKPETDMRRWKTHALLPTTSGEDAMNWIFVSDVLNFSFWSEDESKKYQVDYKGTTYTGYWSLCAAMNQALDEGKNITDPEYYKDITMDQLRDIFRSDSKFEMPLLEERQKVLHEAGKILVDKYEGRFVKMIEKADKSAQSLVELITGTFTSFQDVVEFEGQKLAIYKRAQILVADIWSCCEGEGYGEFKDIDSITMFADYRIPQALAWFGALEYSEDLQKILEDPEHRFKSGDRQEVEIRGCSIHAVDLIVEEVKKQVKADVDLSSEDVVINAVVTDHFLWDYRREHAKENEKNVPMHRIRCIYY